jgi:hypothetical protein
LWRKYFYVKQGVERRIEDLSAGGVRLWIDFALASFDLTEFYLILSAKEQVRRRCRLLWRGTDTIGALFILEDKPIVDGAVSDSKPNSDN